MSRCLARHQLTVSTRSARGTRIMDGSPDIPACSRRSCSIFTHERPQLSFHYSDGVLQKSSFANIYQLSDEYSPLSAAFRTFSTTLQYLPRAMADPRLPPQQGEPVHSQVGTRTSATGPSTTQEAAPPRSTQTAIEPDPESEVMPTISLIRWARDAHMTAGSRTGNRLCVRGR